MNWAKKMCDSVLRGKPRLNQTWAYDNGVVMKGFERVYKSTGDRKYYDFIKDYYDYFVNEKGDIKTYNPQEYNIDHINNGKLLFMLYENEKDEKYKKAAYLLKSQLDNHPRTKEGGFWHKMIYENQMWLDGLYMGAPFYAEFIKNFGGDYEDVIKQFTISYSHTRDRKTNLLYHAWDENKSQFWADKETGLSRHIWGRAMGWYMMALCDTLEIIPKGYKGRCILEDMLRELIEAVVPYQSKEGVWYQVVDKGQRKGNYLEASCSCMFLFAICYGINNKIVGREKYLPYARKAYNGIIDEFIMITDDGFVQLNKTCQVAGLGNVSKRDGSFAYYISEPIISNDIKGVGAFINAMTEYEKTE